MIEHRNLRVLFVVKFAVYVDFHVEKFAGKPTPDRPQRLAEHLGITSP
jgi:hypothetical protein